MADSTYNTIKTRGNRIDDAVDSAVAGDAPSTAAPTPQPAAKPTPVRGTHNPDNLLPDNDSIFHKIKRGLGLE